MRAPRPAVPLETLLEVFFTLVSGSRVRSRKIRPNNGCQQHSRIPGQAGASRASRGGDEKNTRPREVNEQGSGPLAAGDARLDVVEARDELGDAVDDVVGAALIHTRVGALAPPLAVGGVEGLDLLPG